MRLGAPAYGLVTRIVQPGSSEAKSSPEAQRALVGALDLLRAKEVIPEFGAVREWASVRAEHPDAHVVRAHPILGVKHSESSSEAKWKARIVAGGNNVRDTSGQHVVDAMDTAAPASLEGIRAVIAVSFSTKGGDVLQLDVEAAYLHAPLTGQKYFVELPAALWPAS